MPSNLTKRLERARRETKVLVGAARPPRFHTQQNLRENG